MASEPHSDLDALRMLRVKDGDQAAFRELFDAWAGRLLGYVNRLLRNQAQSEEVVQEVFFKVYKARQRYEPTARFSTWLLTIATRAAWNSLRAGKRHQGQAAFEETLHTPSAQPALDPQARAEGIEIHQQLEDAIGGLPSSQRTAMLLVRLEGMSYGECADVMEMSVSAVKSLLFRATRSVQAALAGKGVPVSNRTPVEAGT